MGYENMKTYCFKEFEGCMCASTPQLKHFIMFQPIQCRKCAYTDSVIAKRVDEAEAYEEQKNLIEWDAYAFNRRIDRLNAARFNVSETEAYAEDKARDEEEAYHENSLRNIARSKPNDNAFEPFELTINLGANHSLKRVGDIILVEPSESVTKAKAIARVKEIKNDRQIHHITWGSFNGDHLCNDPERGAVNELMAMFGITEEDLN